MTNVKTQKKPDIYAVFTEKNSVWYEQKCKTRHQLNSIIKEARGNACTKINIEIIFKAN